MANHSAETIRRGGGLIYYVCSCGSEGGPYLPGEMWMANKHAQAHLRLSLNAH